MTAKSECNCCYGSGRVTRDPDIGTDQECFVCDGLGVILDEEFNPDWSLLEATQSSLREHMQLLIDARNAALDEAKLLFNQPHQEYFGQEIQDAIEALKEVK